MRRPLTLVLLIIVVLLVAGFLALGIFPPDPRVEPVERVIPNERFRTQ